MKKNKIKLSVKPVVAALSIGLLATMVASCTVQAPPHSTKTVVVKSSGHNHHHQPQPPKPPKPPQPPPPGH